MDKFEYIPSTITKYTDDDFNNLKILIDKKMDHFEYIPSTITKYTDDDFNNLKILIE